MRRFIFAIIIGLIHLPSFAWADCDNPTGTMGKIIYNGDTNAPQFCNGSDWIALGNVNPSAGGDGCEDPLGTEGQIIYNGDLHVPQYCDGDDWRAMIGYVKHCEEEGGGLTGCDDIGDTCSDGTIYAGSFNGYELYVAPSDEGAYDWGGVGNEFHGIVDPDDGAGNTEWLVNNSPLSHPAAEACATKTTGGHTDWYLPARNELNQIWEYLVDQNSDDTPGGPLGSTFSFLTGGEWYWSSTEHGHYGAYGQQFSAGQQENYNKEDVDSVRCVRKE